MDYLELIDKGSRLGRFALLALAWETSFTGPFGTNRGYVLEFIEIGLVWF